MNPNPNPYRSPTHDSETRRKSWFIPIILGVVGAAGIFFLGLQLVGALVMLGGIIWLFVRSARDGAYSDPILFLTGVSLMAYVVARWDRAKAPVLLCLFGFTAIALGGVVVFE